MCDYEEKQSQVKRDLTRRVKKKSFKQPILKLKRSGQFEKILLTSLISKKHWQ